MKNYKCPECGGELELGVCVDSNQNEQPIIECLGCGDSFFPEDLVNHESHDTMVEFELTHA